MINLNQWGPTTEKRELDISGINEHAMANVQSLLERYMPGGRMDGYEYKCGGLTGGKGESCSTNINTCIGKEFNAGGKGWNDPISLVAAVTNQSMADAAKDLASWLCVDPYKPGPAPVRTVTHTEPTTEEKRAAARKLWEEGTPATSHGYTDRKFVAVHNDLRIHRDGYLMIPFYDEHGVLHGIQRIWEDGKKKALGPFSGRFFEFAGDNSVIYIAEGYATAASVAQATGCTTVMCVSAGNMRAVAERINRLHPASSIVFAADNDPKPDGSNPGVEAAVEASKKIGKGMVIYPPAQPGNKVDWNDYYIEFGPVAVRNMMMPKSNESILMDIEDIPDTEPVFLIDDCVETPCTGAIFGESGAGKSFFALDWAFHVATGRDWLGHKVKQGPVIYIYQEGRVGAKRRLRAWRHKHGVDRLPSSVFQITQRSLVFTPEAVGGFLDDVDNFVRQAGQHPSLVIIDTLARTMAGANENAVQDMQPFINECDRIQQRYNCVVLLVHHSGLGEGAKRRMRGSSALKGAMDLEIFVNNEHGLIEWTKTKDIEPHWPIKYELEKVRFGQGKWDNSMVMTYDMHYDPKEERSTAGEKAALEALQNVCRDSGTTVTTIDTWHDEFNKVYCKYAKTTPSDGALRKAFSVAKKSLEGDQKIGIEGSRVTISSLKIAEEIVTEAMFGNLVKK